MNLKRPLYGGETGTDVRMVQRALNKWTSGVPIPVTSIFNRTTQDRLMAFQVKANISPASGKFGQLSLDKLWPYFDAYGRWRYRLFIPPVVLCFPLPAGSGGEVCQGLHETAGIPGNWAIDFCDAAGTWVLSPEAGIITELSGHDPATATPNPQGVYGWSIYVTTPKHYVYFITHFGHREAHPVGTPVSAGEVLGSIGNQQPYTGRPNHSHVGVTSPLGAVDAKKRITAVSIAPRQS